MEKKSITRKDFLSNCAKIGAASVVATSAIGSLTSCGGGGSSKGAKYTPIAAAGDYYIPELPDKAIDGTPIRVGIIGCGNRGNGALKNIFDAANDVKVVAMADVFQDKIDVTNDAIEKRQGSRVDKKNTFLGWEAYKEICNLPEVNVVLVTSPSIFHSTQAKYAIEKGKHVFCEKAAGIDPVSCRTMAAASMMASNKGLCLQTGAQRHYTRGYVESFRRIQEGYIGKIQSAVLKWNQGPMRFEERKPEWTDMEYMIRDFFSWNWLCGDHVIDQLVHQLDVFQWFSGLKPVSVVAMGSQLQRVSGDIFDNFACDIVYEGGVRVNAQARQIAGCANDVSETIFGTNGSWSSKDMAIRDLDGNIVWQFSREEEKKQNKQVSGYVLEHVDLINHIRKGKHLNATAEILITSSLVGAMCRESAYSGKELKFEEFTMSDLSLMPKELHMGNIPDFEKIYVAPKMGVSASEWKKGNPTMKNKK